MRCFHSRLPGFRALLHLRGAYRGVPVRRQPNSSLPGAAMAATKDVWLTKQDAGGALPSDSDAAFVIPRGTLMIHVRPQASGSFAATRGERCVLG